MHCSLPQVGLDRNDECMNVTPQCLLYLWSYGPSKCPWSLQAPRRLLFDLTGQFDEKVFSGLDFVLAEAGRRGLKLILALTNYWTPFGGMAQYVK